MRRINEIVLEDQIKRERVDISQRIKTLPVATRRRISREVSEIRKASQEYLSSHPDAQCNKKRGKRSAKKKGGNVPWNRYKTG